jgi:hypothetical protein
MEEARQQTALREDVGMTRDFILRYKLGRCYFRFGSRKIRNQVILVSVCEPSADELRTIGPLATCTNPSSRADLHTV